MTGYVPLGAPGVIQLIEVTEAEVIKHSFPLIVIVRGDVLFWDAPSEKPKPAMVIVVPPPNAPDVGVRLLTSNGMFITNGPLE